MLKKSRPLIGICTRMDLDSDRFYLCKQYSEAVFHAGGIPVLLPLIDQGAYAEPLSEAVDGILLSGSHSDVDPHLYREEPHPRLGTVNSRRDRLDYLLLEQALNRKKPLLAICYGFQILNVYLGGSLWQDLEAQVKGCWKHSQQAPDEYQSHTVDLKPGTLIHQLASKKSIQVNSYHHQGIRKVAPCLQAVAVSSDKIVEAIELKKKTQYLLGLQWHPEIGWETNDLSQKIFASFVAASAEKQG